MGPATSPSTPRHSLRRLIDGPSTSSLVRGPSSQPKSRNGSQCLSRAIFCRGTQALPVICPRSVHYLRACTIASFDSMHHRRFVARKAVCLAKTLNLSGGRSLANRINPIFFATGTLLYQGYHVSAHRDLFQLGLKPHFFIRRPRVRLDDRLRCLNAFIIFLSVNVQAYGPLRR